MTPSMASTASLSMTEASLSSKRRRVAQWVRWVMFPAPPTASRMASAVLVVVATVILPVERPSTLNGIPHEYHRARHAGEARACYITFGPGTRGSAPPARRQPTGGAVRIPALLPAAPGSRDGAAAPRIRAAAHCPVGAAALSASPPCRRRRAKDP